MRQPGIEPGSHGWEPYMITTTPQALTDLPKTTSARFELTRAEPSRFLIYRLNHSAKMPLGCDRITKEVLPGLEPGSQDSES